jgi:iron complex transport system ATP-binding protein
MDKVRFHPNPASPNEASPRGARPEPSVLRAHSLGHQFQPNWWCLKEISLAFRLGELVGLLGPNGAGKTTLVRALAGQLHPTAGEVTLDGAPLGGWGRLEVARRIGYLPQDVRSSFSFSCEEVVAQGRYPHLGALGLLGRHDREVVRRSMEWTATLAFARRPLNDLSGGERQRVLLASVLAQESRFLLLDEPTAALDLHHQVDVFERISQLAHEGLGVIVITHDLNLAAQYCDRLVLLHEGRIAAAGAPAQIMVEDVLKRIYETDLMVHRNPVTGTPMVVLLGRRTKRLSEEFRREEGRP